MLCMRCHCSMETNAKLIHSIGFIWIAQMRFRQVPHGIPIVPCRCLCVCSSVLVELWRKCNLCGFSISSMAAVEWIRGYFCRVWLLSAHAHVVGIRKTCMKLTSRIARELFQSVISLLFVIFSSSLRTFPNSTTQFTQYPFICRLKHSKQQTIYKIPAPRGCWPMRNPRVAWALQ